jgi:hypothetical protein
VLQHWSFEFVPSLELGARMIFVAGRGESY